MINSEYSKMKIIMVIIVKLVFIYCLLEIIWFMNIFKD